MTNGPENLGSTSEELGKALEVAEKVNELRANNEITYEFLSTLENSSHPVDVELFQAFANLDADIMDSDSDEIINAIDSTIDSYKIYKIDNETSEVYNLGDALDNEEAAIDTGLYDPATGTLVDGYVWKERDSTENWTILRATGITNNLANASKWTEDEAYFTGLLTYNKEEGKWYPNEGYTWADSGSTDNWKLNKKDVAPEIESRPVIRMEELSFDDTEVIVGTTREDFMKEKGDLITKNRDGSFSIDLLANPHYVRLSKFRDFNDNFLDSKNPDTVNVIVGETKYTWNAENRNWYDESGDKYLKVYSKKLTFKVEEKTDEEDKPGPVDTVDTVDTEPRTSDQPEETVTTAPVETEAEEVVKAPHEPEKTDKSEKSATFTASIENAEDELSDLEASYRRVKRQVEKGNIRDLTEFKTAYDAMNTMIQGIDNELNHLVALRIYSPDQGSYQMRVGEINALKNAINPVAEWLNQPTILNALNIAENRFDLTNAQKRTIMKDIRLLDKANDGKITRIGDNRYQVEYSSDQMTRRRVQINGAGDWYDIPYIARIDRELGVNGMTEPDANAFNTHFAGAMALNPTQPQPTNPSTEAVAGADVNEEEIL